MLVKKIKSITTFYISLFYGPYFNREELSKRFEKWRKSQDRDEVEKIIILSSFLANGSGARGTPSIFINDKF